jgi:hypothetical protein
MGSGPLGRSRPRASRARGPMSAHRCAGVDEQRATVRCPEVLADGQDSAAFIAAPTRPTNTKWSPPRRQRKPLSPSPPASGSVKRPKHERAGLVVLHVLPVEAAPAAVGLPRCFETAPSTWQAQTAAQTSAPRPMASSRKRTTALPRTTLRRARERVTCAPRRAAARGRLRPGRGGRRRRSRSAAGWRRGGSAAPGSWWARRLGRGDLAVHQADLAPSRGERGHYARELGGPVLGASAQQGRAAASTQSSMRQPSSLVPWIRPAPSRTAGATGWQLRSTHRGRRTAADDIGRAGKLAQSPDRHEVAVGCAAATVAPRTGPRGGARSAHGLSGRQVRPA